MRKGGKEEGGERGKRGGKRETVCTCIVGSPTLFTCSIGHVIQCTDIYHANKPNTIWLLAISGK